MGGVGTAVIAAAVIGAGSAAYQSDQQKQIADDDARKREAAAADEQARLDKIAKDTRPDDVSLSDEIDFGAKGESGSIGSVNDFVVNKGSSQSALGGSGRSGLGFVV